LLTRKATSEVIAALLLIVITVAAAVLLYTFSSGLLGRLQETSNQQPYLEQLTLDYYDWTNLSSLKLTVRNVGVSKIALVDFFIAGRRNSTNLTFASGCASDGVLLVQSSPCLIVFPMPSGFLPNATFAYSVKMITKNGATFSYSCIAGTTS